MSMKTQNDLLDEMAKVSSISKAQASRELGHVFDGITSILASIEPGDGLQLIGRITFNKIKTKAMLRRNPQTGQQMQSPSKIIVKAKIGTGLIKAAQ